MIVTINCSYQFNLTLLSFSSFSTVVNSDIVISLCPLSIDKNSLRFQESVCQLLAHPEGFSFDGLSIHIATLTIGSH